MPIFSPPFVGGTSQASYTDGQLLIGDSTTNELDKGVITTTGGAVVTVGHGTININAAGGGLSAPNPGTSGGVVYYNTTTTLASSALLNNFEVVLGGGAGGAPFTPVGAGASSAYLSFNAVTNLNIISPPAGTVLQLADADGNGTALEIDAGANSPRATFYRANTQLGSPTALNANDIFASVNGQGHDGTNRSVSSALMRYVAVNPWTTADHSCFIQFQAIPSGTLTVTTLAQLKAPADGGSQLIGTTAADNAIAGFDGEILEQIILVANEVNINAQANVATITVTPGDWDVTGELWVDNSTGVATLTGRVVAGISQTSATLPTVPATGTARTGMNFALSASAANTAFVVVPVGPCRVNVNSNTQLWLVGIANVTGGGNAFGYGKIRARRVR